MKNISAALKLVVLLAIPLVSGYSFGNVDDLDTSMLHLYCYDEHGVILGPAHIERATDPDLRFINHYGLLYDQAQLTRLGLKPFSALETNTAILRQEGDMLLVYSELYYNARQDPRVLVKHRTTVNSHVNPSDKKVVFPNKTNAEDFCKGLLNVCRSTNSGSALVAAYTSLQKYSIPISVAYQKENGEDIVNCPFHGFGDD